MCSYATPTPKTQSALAVRQQRSNAESDGLRAMQENMLDLMPDEARDLQAKRQVMHWDRQKKKYIKVWHHALAWRVRLVSVRWCPHYETRPQVFPP